MGLLDILNGMQNGPRGQRDPNSGGMSPITMALLGLLAYKAYKGMTAGQPQTANPAGRPTPLPPPSGTATATANDGELGGLLGGLLGGGQGRTASPGGGMGDLLKGGALGGLGGLLAGGAAGGMLSGGLNDLLKQLQQGGQGDVADTWVSNGPNKAISPNDLASALGADRVGMLTDQTGMSQQELMAALSEQLPDFINQLTPNGRPPTEQEMSRMI